MKKRFEIITSYTTCAKYIVEAEDEKEAVAKFNEGLYSSWEELPDWFDNNEVVEEVSEALPEGKAFEGSLEKADAPQ